MWNNKQSMQQVKCAPSRAYVAIDFVINPHFG